MIRSIRKGALTATLLGMGFSTSSLAQSLAQSPYGANRPTDNSAKKEAGTTPESGPMIPQPEETKRGDSLEVLPFPKAEETVSQIAPAIIPPAEFSKVPVRVSPLDKVQVPDSSPIPSVPATRLDKVQEPDSSSIPIVPAARLDKVQEPDSSPIPSVPAARLDKVQEPDSPPIQSAPAAPKAQVIVEPVQNNLVAPPVSTKTERPSLWKRLFGKPDAPSSCQTNCVPCDPKAVNRVAPVVPPDATTAGRRTIESRSDSTPGRAAVDSTPGRATVDGAPGRATIDLSAAADRTQLANLPRNQDPLSIANGISSAQQRTQDPEAVRLQKIKELLKTDMLPSHRMAAADEILQCVPGRIGEVRAALLKSAQEDPAACVRAACIHALSKLNTRDDDFSSLLDASLEDESADVRDEANFALEKLKRK
jgi:hypothetical protein